MNADAAETNVQEGPEPPEALRPALRALEDAHDQWHEAFDAYHEPAEIRRRIETVVQTLRNITFRLQSVKSDLDFDFDAWYQPWQDYMRSSDPMAWLNDARIAITKRRGLSTNSFAKVSYVSSYLEPATTVLRLAADTSTEAIVARALEKVPRDSSQHIALEVKRKWTTEGVVQAEVLGLLAWCFHILDALLVAAVEMSGDTQPPETPEEFVRSVALWPCMLVSPSHIPQLFASDTGQPLELTLEAMGPSAPRSYPRAEVRYKRAIAAAEGLPSDPLDRAGRFHEVARLLFKRDGTYMATIQLLTEAGWMLLPYQPADKREKYIIWHEVGRLVLLHRASAVIATGEMWMAEATGAPEPYAEVAGMPGRREALITHVATADGGTRGISSEIVRVLDKPFLKRAVEAEFDPSVPGYFSPILSAWSTMEQTQFGAS